MGRVFQCLMWLMLAEVGWSLSPCQEEQICVTKQRCDETDDSGKRILGPRIFPRICGQGLVCCDKAQLESYEASLAMRQPKQLRLDVVSDYKSCAPQRLCVPWHLCRTGIVNEDGRYILTPRLLNASSEACSTFESCCPVADQLGESESPAGPHLKEFQYKGCGYSNPKGLYYDLVGYSDHEARYAEFPWMVAVLDRQFKYVCGGTLIHPQLVLTTAHNVANHSSGSLLVRAGEYDLSSDQEMFAAQDRELRSLWPHPQFNNLSQQHDIAMLVLERPFQLAPHVQPLCLPPQESSMLQEDLRQAKCFAIGWGHRTFSNSTLEHILKRVDLPILEHQLCQRLLRRTVLGRRFRLHASFLCAGGVEGKDTCNGDGGSPLFCSMVGQDNRYQLAGIVSWGLQCADKDVPSAYTNVPYLRRWVDEQVLRSGLQLAHPYR